MHNLTANSQNRYVALRIFSGTQIDRLGMNRSPIEGKVWYTALVCLYSSLAIVFFVLPVGNHFGGVLLGTGTYRHDAVLNAGILEWGFRSIWSADLRFFDWPPGFPLRGTLAATENLVGWQLFYSPLRSVGVSVAASYNVSLLASLVISGVGCAVLALRLGASRTGAAIGGTVFAFNPFHLDHMIHLQTMAVCWSPFAVLGLDMALEKASAKGLALITISIVMTVLSGMYFGVFLVLILPSYALLCWLTGRHRFSAARAALAVAACLIAGLILTPLLLHYLEYVRAYGRYPHSGAEVSLSALSLRSLLQTPVWLTSWRETRLATIGTGGFASAFPGIATLCLMVIGLAAVKVRPGRQEVGVLVALAALCLVVALGPTLLVRRGEPLPGAQWIPLPGQLFLYFSAVRWPMRIYMYAVMCMGVLAAFGATAAGQLTAPRWRPWLSALIFAALLIELRPAGWYVRSSTGIANPIRTSDAYAFLERERDHGGLVELPSKMDSGITTPFATRYAYGSSGHLRGTIAFHGSMFPPLLDSLRIASFALPNPEAVALLRKNGVTRVVIHSDLMSPDSSKLLVGSFRNQGFPVVFLTPRSTVFSLTH